jgi:prepilin-type N-terminal cleavage/methylation domain-containing protein
VTEAAAKIQPATRDSLDESRRIDPSRRARSGATRRGFTLLELLIVMGVMLILISMLFIGLKYVTTNTKTRDTKAALQTAQTLFTNYEQATHLSPTGPQPISPGWSGGIAAPGNITSDTTGLNSQPLPAYTESVMALLLTIPENKKIVQSLPANKVSTVLGSSPVLLDGWGDPILLAPGNNGSATWGLTGVTTSAGSNLDIKSPDGRPFWVSAGPDGSVSNGDDNIYSFQ